MITTRPVRVLHIVRQMDPGGVETWLMHVLRHVDKAQWQMDVLTHSSGPGILDEEARDLGASVIPGPPPGQLFAYTRNYLDVLRRTPRYDVVHSHVHHFSAFTLELARYTGVPIRIAHSHSDTSAQDSSARGARRLYLGATRRMLERAPTDRLAASGESARALFGPTWGRDERDRILHYGIDLAPFKGGLDRAAVRRDLGVPPGSFVIGHVGRFEPVKNHAFLIDMMSEVVRRDADAVLLLVGTGSLRQQVERLATARGLGDRVIFAGSRSDVPAVMRAAMDVFVLPSLFEGLPMVGLEAQAAGLPCLFSSTVTRETSAVPQLTHFLPRGASAADWAIAALDARTPATAPSSAAVRLAGTSFDVHSCINGLTQIYTSGMHAFGQAEAM